MIASTAKSTKLVLVSSDAEQFWAFCYFYCSYRSGSTAEGTRRSGYIRRPRIRGSARRIIAHTSAITLRGRPAYLHLSPLGTFDGKTVAAGLPRRLSGNSLRRTDDHSSGFGSTSRGTCLRHIPETGDGKLPGERSCLVPLAPRDDSRHQLIRHFFLRHTSPLFCMIYWEELSRILRLGLLLARL